ncbi:putative Mid2 domain-containing protein [Seiridium cardinale]|uniref:Mid2 domain-containing protein n=1 Tax=Seiridium cardinale TaxID=138064 RepID=A0ABR2Y6N8_9PEZI
MRLEILFTLLPLHALCMSLQTDQACGTVPGQIAVPHDVGNFTFPNGATPKFSAGTAMNISWTTTFILSTLWLITGCDFANPTKSLLAGSLATYYVWEVETDYTNSSELYSFRVVDSSGDAAAQRSGAFWSAVFYISGGITSSSSLSGTSLSVPSTTFSASSTSSSAATVATFSSTSTTMTQTSSGEC